MDEPYCSYFSGEIFPALKQVDSFSADTFFSKLKSGNPYFKFFAERPGEFFKRRQFYVFRMIFNARDCRFFVFNFSANCSWVNPATSRAIFNMTPVAPGSGRQLQWLVVESGFFIRSWDMELYGKNAYVLFKVFVSRENRHLISMGKGTN